MTRQIRLARHDTLGNFRVDVLSYASHTERQVGFGNQLYFLSCGRL